MSSSRFEILSNFICNEMRMSHIYQPAMLLELLARDGEASTSEIAAALLSHDQSQVEYYEQITKNMVGKVLTENRGVTEKLKSGNRITGYRLTGADELSHDERQELIDLCNEKLSEYVDRRGGRIWQHRTNASGYIPGTVRYEVLKRAKYRCQLCGTSAEQKALEVDHILPRSLGGQDDISNFQALCYSCNATKRDRDDEDFRGVAKSYAERQPGCLFCEPPRAQIVAENELVYAYLDGYPVTEMHTLFIPKRHADTYFDLYQPEINAIHQLIDQRREEIMQLDPTVSGFNIGMNCGEDAGQSVMHCHVHLIPRRKGDVETPKGGVRGVIPARQQYDKKMCQPGLSY
jgi:ATP adenylyltransferase